MSKEKSDLNLLIGIEEKLIEMDIPQSANLSEKEEEEEVEDQGKVEGEEIIENPINILKQRIEQEKIYSEEEKEFFDINKKKVEEFYEGRKKCPRNYSLRDTYYLKSTFDIDLTNEEDVIQNFAELIF